MRAQVAEQLLAGENGSKFGRAERNYPRRFAQIQYRGSLHLARPALIMLAMSGLQPTSDGAVATINASHFEEHINNETRHPSIPDHYPECCRVGDAQFMDDV